MNSLQHIAIIMDGNGRWAKKSLLPRVAGHVRGVKRVHDVVEQCITRNIPYLTLFAFGRENWRRPEEEVSFLMNLLLEQLTKEFHKLDTQNVCVRFIGDTTRVPIKVQHQIKHTQQTTQKNTRLYLTIALDYSGRYDIVTAVNNIIKDKNAPDVITEEIFNQYLLSYPYPDPDLFIRTGGESRISNFLLWQLSYSECYFTKKLWPDFDKKSLDAAIEWFHLRERRFGMTSEQLKQDQ